ncbi:MAG: LCP family protein [Christensenellales bacterium]
MEHRRKKKGSSKLLIIMVIVLALLAIAAIFALKFYTDINNPENLFESTLPEGTPAPVETAPAPADEEAQPSPTPDQESLLSGQADAEFMSNRTNILLLGIDESTERENWGTFRTDTMILVSIDFSNNDVCMVSIPRDSYVKIYNANGSVANPSSPYSKINNAFSEGGGAQKKGFEYSIATVEKLMGVNIGYYCGFNMNVVKEVVNAMGGVDYDVDIEVKMNGRELHPGMQHLDGQGVLDYCRQRKGSSDIARIDRQQRMLTAILQQLKDTDQIANIPSIYSAVEANIMTNLSIKQISSLALVALRMDMSQLSRYTLEGKAMDIQGRDCYCLYVSRIEKIVREVWGQSVNLDSENDVSFIEEQVEANRALIADELNRANIAYSKAYSIMNNCRELIDKSSYDTLKAAAKELLDAIQKENKENLDAYTPYVEQLCDSICSQYGISIY